ncbi:glycosyltransferase family 90 protein, partial [Aaosphaeria arxii CBS 175.79]
HPIDELIADAEKGFSALLKTEAVSLKDAAAKYRRKRGRHPPPDFDAWYNFASSSGSVIVEDFWDQIYHDLGPFWGVNPSTLRQQAHGLKPKISIRNGKVESDPQGAYTKLQQWTDMVLTLSSHKHVRLPDVDLPFNVNEEPALAVPWETIDTMLSFSRRIKASIADVQTSFTDLETPETTANETFGFDPEWLGPRRTHPASALGPRPYWTVVRPACHPRSPSRLHSIMSDIWDLHGRTSEAHSAVNITPGGWPLGTLRGYVKNWTIATDVCRHSHLQGLHGAFVAPEHMSVSEKMFPLFGASKFSMSNEILLPGALEWNRTEISSSVDHSVGVNWATRQDKLFWRGPATGGQYSKSNWNRSHRHRFVGMLNGSNILMVDQSPNVTTSGQDISSSRTFRLPSRDAYLLPSRHDHHLAAWVSSWADASFRTETLDCEKLSGEESPRCPSSFFSVAQAASGRDIEQHKYTAVVDGNGGDDGGEFTRALENGLVTLRGSVYRQWYDARIKPWVHYVPMDNTFIDLLGIMEYFLPWSVGHDEQARKIAKTGQKWARKVLRREDMLIYVYRLILEFARVVDDSRERLGWVE